MINIPLSYWKSNDNGAVLTTDELVLYLDATNPASYSGSGTTTWNNLVSGNNNVNLYYGATAFNQANTSLLPQYSTEYGGSVFFSRNNYSFGRVTLNGISSSSPNAITVEFWGKLESAGMGAWMPFGFFSPAFYNLFNLNGGLGFNTGSGECYGMDSTGRQNWGIWDKVNHYVFVLHQNQSTSNNVMYVNGVKFTAPYMFLGSNENASQRTFANGLFNINGSTDNYFGDFYVGEFRVYKKILTDQEVRNNFEVTRTRYGKLPYKERVAESNLTHYYDFENSTQWYGESTSLVTDYSGLMKVGSLSGGSSWQSGESGYMAFRTAQNRDIALNKNATNLGIFYGSFSLVNVVRSSDTNITNYIFGSNNAFTSGNNVNVGFVSQGYRHSHNSASPPNSNSVSNLSSSTWYHIVSTYDYDTYTVKIYVNGVVIISNGFQERVVGNEMYYLGRANGATYEFDLGLSMGFNKVLSQSEVTTLFSKQRIRFGI